MDLVKIGGFLAELRHEKGLTQEKLGELLGVSNKTISRWETGTYLPPVEMLQELSSTYNVSINEILSGERLTKDLYEEKAEENLKAVIEKSTFSLKDKAEYFKNKWRKDHIFEFVISLIVVIALFFTGFMFNKKILVAAYISPFVLYIILYNRMMQYVERYAYE